MANEIDCLEYWRTKASYVEALVVSDLYGISAKPEICQFNLMRAVILNLRGVTAQNL